MARGVRFVYFNTRHRAQAAKIVSSAGLRQFQP